MSDTDATEPSLDAKTLALLEAIRKADQERKQRRAYLASRKAKAKRARAAR